MKVVFFDAEGTLYIPKKGKRPEDFWDRGEHTLERAKEHFELNCCVNQTLENLKERDYLMAVVSKHKDHLLPDLLKHFGIDGYFSGVMIGEDKAHMMLDFLTDKDIPKNEAIIVGDTLEMDIQPAEKVGITGLHLDGKKMKCVRDLLRYIDEKVIR